MMILIANYSPNHVFLDIQNSVNSSFVVDFVDKCIETKEGVSMDLVDNKSKKNAVVTACNSKYFKACLTFITLLYKHSEKYIDVIYVLILG